MRIPPPEVILSWPPPRYDDPETRGRANEIVSLVLLAVATVVISIRTYTRKYITKGFGWDDILVILAFIPATAFVVVGMISMDRYGWGRHVWDVPVERFTGSLQMGLASQILFDLATSFTKLSMLALIYRIAHEASRKFSLLVVGLEVLISVNCVLFMMVAMLQCRPLSLYWTLSTKPQNCINEAAHLLVAGIINTLTDFVVVLLPLALVRIVYKNKLTSRQMLIVNLLFGAGFLACFAGVARTYFTWIMTTEPDVTWNAWMNWLMSSLELFLGIVCTSIPSTKPFFNKYIPKLLASTSHRSHRTDEPVSTDKATKGSALGSQLSFESNLEEGDAHALTMRSQTLPADARRRSSEANLDKPLPAVTRKNSVYTINIQLDEASLSPADRGDYATTNRPKPGRSQQLVHNFSRPKVLYSRNGSESHSQRRLSLYSTSGSPYPGRAESIAGGSIRYSHILDDLDSPYGQSIGDGMEPATHYMPHGGQISYAPSAGSTAAHARGHAKNPSVGTFGGG